MAGVSIRNVYKSYGTVQAIRGISMDIADGEFVVMVGPSGCGKSTLLNLLGLLDNPTDGEYYFLDQEVSKFSERQRANTRKANIGFVFQSFNLIDELTVYENVELPLFYLGVSASERKKRVSEVLEHMQIMHRKNHFPQQLSGGQQQRVAVARAVVAKPKLILADEPTGNLDSAHGDEVMKMLTDLNDAGTTIVMVTPAFRNALATSGRPYPHPIATTVLPSSRSSRCTSTTWKASSRNRPGSPANASARPTSR